MEPSSQLKEYGLDKLTRLEKYTDSVLDADVTFTVEKFRHRVVVVLSTDGLKIKAEHESDDMYTSLDMVVDKLEKQIKRHREKQKSYGKASGGIKNLSPSQDQESSPEPTFSRMGGGNGAATDEDHEKHFGILDQTILDLPLLKLSENEALSKISQSTLPFLLYLDDESGGIRLLRHTGSGSLELVRFHPEDGGN
jgi:putative sigma-54 modulation protein